MKLVILPGMDGTGKLLDPFVAELKKLGIASTVIAYPADRTLSYAELEELVLGYLPEDEEFAILGESFSGPITLALAQRKIRGLAAVILVVTFASPPESMLLKMTGVLPVSLILSFPIPCWMARRVMFAGADAPDGPENFCTVIKETEPEVIADRLKSVRKLRLSKEKIDLPALYIQGTLDNLLPESSLEGVKRLVPGVAVKRIDGPHLVLDTNPAECAAAVAEFLSGIGS
jgi:pimeloyl-[acyl-carrier protein] methyl ester esterase